MISDGISKYYSDLTSIAVSTANKLSLKVQKNVSRDITDYNAHPLIEVWTQKLTDDVFEYPLDYGILGHTESDSLGVSVMTNKNITDPCRKLFTLTHELGHLFLHPQQIMEGLPFDKESTIKLSNNNDPLEVEANAFAAHLLLPDRVLKFDVLSCLCIDAIKHKSSISKTAIKWRVVDVLQNDFFISRDVSILIATEFSNCHQNSLVMETKLYQIFYCAFDPSNNLKVYKHFNENKTRHAI